MRVFNFTENRKMKAVKKTAQSSAEQDRVQALCQKAPLK
jgi:hypothetical protein